MEILRKISAVLLFFIKTERKSYKYECPRRESKKPEPLVTSLCLSSGGRMKIPKKIAKKRIDWLAAGIKY